MASMRLSRPITRYTSTTTLALCSLGWSDSSMPISKKCRMMTMALSYSPPLQGMLSWLILRSSARSSGCQYFKSLPVPSMTLFWLHLWMSSLSSFMLSRRVRSEPLPSGLVLCLPRTACSRRSSSTIFGLL